MVDQARELWCERNESAASAHGHTDECYRATPAGPKERGEGLREREPHDQHSVLHREDDGICGGCGAWWPCPFIRGYRVAIAAPVGREHSFDQLDGLIADRLAEHPHFPDVAQRIAALAATPAPDSGAEPMTEPQSQAEALRTLNQMVLNGELDCLRAGVITKLRDLITTPTPGPTIDPALVNDDAPNPETGQNAATPAPDAVNGAWSAEDDNACGHGSEPGQCEEAADAAIAALSPAGPEERGEGLDVEALARLLREFAPLDTIEEARNVAVVIARALATTPAPDTGAEERETLFPPLPPVSDVAWQERLNDWPERATAHPDDGHEHRFTCIRCGVDTGAEERLRARDAARDAARRIGRLYKPSGLYDDLMEEVTAAVLSAYLSGGSVDEEAR